MLCLIISHDDYNTATGRYMVVEVVAGAAVPSGAMICDLGTVGIALTGVPIVVGQSWFAEASSPLATIDRSTARTAANQVKSIIGP
ncbi:MAG: hypothetical protein HOQ24_08610 [Mycobacteriaceae bacterium]|nr:hypothetical protein [Mycobacteriaceae bacterium]